jgi:FkbM family methyltransferase
MLSDLIDKVVPTKLRHRVGGFIFYYIIRRSRVLLYPYIFVLTGKMPRGIKFLPNHECEAYGIRSTWDGIWIFMEIFQDEIYEKVGRPRKGDIVLDIGAYMGMFTVKMAKLVGNAGRVVAVEPESKNLSYLRRNIEGLNNVSVVGKAASSCTGKANLYISIASPCHTLISSHSDCTEVETTTVDELVSQMKLPRVDFVKIDAEGSELEILKGSEKVLASDNLKLAIAAYHDLPNGKPEMPEIVDYLKIRGFEIHTERGYVYAKKEVKQ